MQPNEVSPKTRCLFAESVRHYASGLISESELWDQYYNSAKKHGHDTLSRSILGDLMIELDTPGGLLPKESRRNPYTRRCLARVIAFLYTDNPYVEARVWRDRSDINVPTIVSGWERFLGGGLGDEISPWTAVACITFYGILYVCGSGVLPFGFGTLLVGLLIVLCVFAINQEARFEMKHANDPVPAKLQRRFEMARPHRRKLDQQLYPFASDADLLHARLNPHLLAGSKVR